MLKSQMHAVIRSEVGSNACHRIRNHGHVPAVVYGNHVASQTIEVNKKELDSIVKKYGTNILVDLNLGNQEVTVMLKDIQRNPITREIMHVDFQQVSYDQPIHVNVPIKLVGKAKLASKDSVLQQQLRELHVECLPKYLPESIEVDVSILSPGHPLRVMDVEFGQELAILNDPQEIIAALTKAERVAEKAESEEEGLLERVMESPRSQE